MALLGICLFFYILRIALYPKHVLEQLRTNIIETSCLASIGIAFTTIIQMISVQFGHFAGLVAYVLWWVNAAMAVTVLIGIPYVQLKLQPPGLQNIPPSVLLPYIAALTSAAAGGVVCQYGNLSARLQVPVIIVSYLEIGAGLAAAVSIDGVVFSQHYNRRTPTQETVCQDMILCGPFGQGSFALQSLGIVVMKSFGEYNRGTFLTAAAGTPIAYVSMFAGLLSWGYGTFWWCFAIISIFQTLLGQQGGWRAVRYNMSAWSLVFPWVISSSALTRFVCVRLLINFQGVYTNGAVQLGKIMDSPAFKVWSTALLLILLVLWFMNQIFTVKGIITGVALGLDHGWRWRYLPESADADGRKDA